jgi:hypothetical protein
MPPGGAMHRGDHYDHSHSDPYQVKGKYPEPTVCPGCGAVYHHGRWEWGEAPADAHATPCPACRRIKDKMPAGYVTLKGPFVDAHRNELIGLVANEETRAKAERPLERIIAIEPLPGRIFVTTTDVHLPRRIGEAIHHAWRGELKISYGEDEYLVRVHWQR